MTVREDRAHLRQLLAVIASIIATALALLAVAPIAAETPELRLFASLGGDSGAPCPGFRGTNLVVVDDRLVIIGAVAHGTDFTPAVCTSPDGSSWHVTEMPALRGVGILDAASDGRTVIALGTRDAAETEDVILSSADGVTWTRTVTPSNQGLSDVTAGPQGFVIAGGARPDGVGYMYALADGVDWQRSQLPDAGRVSAAFVAPLPDGGYVSFGHVGEPTDECGGECNAIWTSADGTHWSSALRPDAINGIGPHGAAAGPPGILLYGPNSVVSSDGQHWRADGDHHWHGANWANGQFVAWGLIHDGDLGIVGTSMNGIDWTVLNTTAVRDAGALTWMSIVPWRGRTIALASAEVVVADPPVQLWELVGGLAPTDTSASPGSPTGAPGPWLAILGLAGAAVVLFERRRRPTGR